jgi:hypothetical protein
MCAVTEHSPLTMQGLVPILFGHAASSNSTPAAHWGSGAITTSVGSLPPLARMARPWRHSEVRIQRTAMFGTAPTCRCPTTAWAGAVVVRGSTGARRSVARRVVPVSYVNGAAW